MFPVSQLPIGIGLLLLVFFFFFFFHGDAFDPLDPQGNITIKWDIQEWRDDINGYAALVTINNYQLYRHTESPGWKLSWEWPNDEVIWSVSGAEATEQGNCSRFRNELPHCCDKRPTIIDLLPGANYDQQLKNCCKGGVLSSMVQNPSRSASSFQVSVGDYGGNGTTFYPQKFDLGLPGYTCGQALNSTPTKFPIDGGRRQIQALGTFEITCSYSPVLARSSPSCCVSMSSFYNQTIVQCPYCSCGCLEGPSPTTCSSVDEPQPILQYPSNGQTMIPPLVRCTNHMCPIRVHWHVKLSYKNYWRVKITVTNFNLIKNYSEWNIVVQHPNLEHLTQIFSFNYRSLDIFPGFNDSGVFWGIPYYNDVLLQYGDNGNVQSEMLLKKDPKKFTFNAGWAFPRRIYFNGEPCVMPTPDLYPRLPNSSSRRALSNSPPLLSSLLLLLILLLC